MLRFKNQLKKPQLLFNKEEFCLVGTTQMKATRCWRASPLIQWTTAAHKDLPVTASPEHSLSALNETSAPSPRLSDTAFEGTMFLPFLPWGWPGCLLPSKTFTQWTIKNLPRLMLISMSTTASTFTVSTVKLKIRITCSKLCTFVAEILQVNTITAVNLTPT